MSDVKNNFKSKYGTTGCDPGEFRHRTNECLNNFASTIGLTLEVAVKMGFIKDGEKLIERSNSKELEK
ncbi:MAG TPA: hypothetical protein VI795_03285 [Patescibacteria group bacterium]|nr:hypothetical protein [Patescibacteria group bacterium]